MAEKMLSAREVADLLGVSADTVYRLSHKRDGLKGYKIGGVTRFRPAEVEAYIEAQAIKPAEKQNPLPGMQRFTYRPGMKVVSL